MIDVLQNRLVCVVAMATNNVIGDGNDLIWHLPGDLRRVKQLTMGCPLIMGRKTYQSIGRPVAGRLNIVLTRNAGFSADGVVAVTSFQAAIERAGHWLAEHNSQTGQDERRIILFGGGEIYRIGLDCCDEIEATIVEDDSHDGVRFPDIDKAAWHDELLEAIPAADSHPAFRYHRLTRITRPASSLVERVRQL